MFWFQAKNKEKKIAAYLQEANQLYEQKKYPQAADIYKKILRLDSNHFAATANLAVCYFELEEHEKAVLYFKQTIEEDSINPWWHNYLSQSYQKIGQYTEALDEAWHAVCLSQGQDEHQLNLAYTIYETATEKGQDLIDSLLLKWYQSYPQSGIVKQSYKSFYPDKNFKGSDIEYIEKLFDVFASDFDAVLADLEYDSPRYIAEKLSSLWSDKMNEKKRILDLGCGSGLCGKFIKEMLPKTQIYGVDISANMLKEAEKKQAYIKLVKSDIAHCFNRTKSMFDAVVSSDVFTYFGALDSLFLNVADSLCSQGLFIFTISKNELNQEPYFLMPSSRFVHCGEYVEDLLKKSGFKLLQKQEKILRKEGDKEVVGWVFVGCKK